ncbi:MAG: helix-turn-helix domain-containing protein [Gammaproteobacteria bacterium]|nr:MAG: helix-turn-helix domain-containing protein [Gammaproteobacteria bacterium]
MAQTKALIHTLKSCLKAQDKTYVDVAKALNLTEASVKRLFSQHSFSLNRLETVCQMLDMQISDLVQQMNESQFHLEQLSEEQERVIADDLLLLLVTVCALNKWLFENMVERYKITEAECIHKLAQLDKLKVIELLPKNKIKLLIAPNFSWRKNGPIQRFFQENIGQEYFKSSFQKEEETLIVLNGMLSKLSNGEFQRKLKRLSREFNDLNNEDSSLDIFERNGVTLVLAMRNWEFGIFKPLQR